MKIIFSDWWTKIANIDVTAQESNLFQKYFFRNLKKLLEILYQRFYLRIQKTIYVNKTKMYL